MSEKSGRASLPALVGELVAALTDLQRELRSSRGARGRGLEQFVRFTSEVTIPAAILVLETNIRALRLLQRGLKLASDHEDVVSAPEQETVGRAVVDRLDGALAEVQTAIEDASVNEGVRERLAEARQLNRELESRLADPLESDKGQTASVDVAAELESLKDEFDDRDPDGTN